MSEEDQKDKVKREFVNNFINQANLSLILQILLKEAEIKAQDYVNSLSAEDLRNVANSFKNNENGPSEPSFGAKISNLLKNIKLKLGLKPKRKGFSTKKIP